MRLNIAMSRTRVSGWIALLRRLLRRMICRAIAPDRSKRKKKEERIIAPQLQYTHGDRVDNHSEMRSLGKIHRELGRAGGIFYFGRHPCNYSRVESKKARERISRAVHFDALSRYLFEFCSYNLVVSVGQIECFLSR